MDKIRILALIFNTNHRNRLRSDHNGLLRNSAFLPTHAPAGQTTTGEIQSAQSMPF